MKPEIYRVAERYGLKVYVVSNSYMNVPRAPGIERSGASLAELLGTRIEQGFYRPGDRLPSVLHSWRGKARTSVGPRSPM